MIRYRETDQGAARFDAALPIAYQRVAAFFGDVPGETTVVVYPDAAALKAAAGTDFSGDAAGLFGNLLAFHSPDSWTAQFRGAPVEQLATHEFTHRAVSHVARGRAPKWLNEGLATYLAGQLPPETLQRVARAVSDGDSYSLPELDAAFRSAALGVDRAGLEAAWRRSLAAR